MADQAYEIKQNVASPHSEMYELMNYIREGKALDLGCGRGRNSFFLYAHGFNVTAVDHSTDAIKAIHNVMNLENIGSGLHAEVYDINNAAITTRFDLVISTVVLQFLDPKKIPHIIANIQEKTNRGGIHLIVAPVSTINDPCPIPFPFTLKANEIADYYRDWDLIKYNEDVGEFHRTDENGNRYKARFATLIARKK